MGKADAFAKSYISRNDVFADVFNFFIYGGQRVILPESLTEKSTEEQAMFPSAAVQKLRDVKKTAVIKQDAGAVYVLLAIEAQSHRDPAMPVRCMVYDALEYERQVKETALRHRRAPSERMAADEYIAGFSYVDPLIPVVTLVIYFGTGKWDAPLSIHQMTKGKYDACLMQFVQDYKINLIQPYAMSDEDLRKFSTDFALVMKFLKVANDKRKIRELLSEEDSPYAAISTEAALVINSCTAIGIKINEETKETNMCQGIKEWTDELIAEALVEERQRQQEAITTAVKKAEDETTINALLRAAKAMTEAFHLSAAQALDALKVSESERCALEPLL